MLARHPSHRSVRSELAVPAPATAAAAPSSPASAPTEPLHILPPAAAAAGETVRRTSLQTGPNPVSISMALAGEAAPEDAPVGSPVMHETLSVIDEHITHMSTPRQSAAALKDLRATDSGSEYSSQHRLSLLNDHDTDDDDGDGGNTWHTEADVRSWSPARVADYLEHVGVDKKHCEVFREQDIDGEALLGVDRNFIFMQEFALGPMGPRLRTWMKINALQSQVMSAKDAQQIAQSVPTFDTNAHSDHPPDTTRLRAASTSSVLPRIPNLRESMGSRGNASRGHTSRAPSSAGRANATLDSTIPLHHMPVSPSATAHRRPSAASIRSMNHNRRHSSIDHDHGSPSTPTVPKHIKSGSNASALVAHHAKTPSFDRGWTMTGAPHSPQPLPRPASSHHVYTASTHVTGFDFGDHDDSTTTADFDRGYFSGGEVDSRNRRNVLRKRDSPSHSRNTSYIPDAYNRTSVYSRRHSRMGSADSVIGNTMSPAAKQYYGNHHKAKNSTSGPFDFVRPLKPVADPNPTVTKLAYDARSINAVANSPHVPGSETSSTGRVSPSPAAAAVPAHSRYFFSKRSPRGFRAISDAITGGEKASVSTGELVTPPHKDSPMQSPTRTGSSTPSRSSLSKSLEPSLDGSKRHTADATSTKQGRKKPKKHGTSAYLKGRQQVTPQEAMANCDYSGWMKKKSSSLMTTWKTRLFVLRGRRLAYYYSENDTEEKGLIDISSHRVLPANNERMTGLHASITRAAASPTSPHNATIQTAASADSANSLSGMDDDMTGMFIFKLVPPRAGLQKGVQFTKPIVHYFAVDSLAVGRLWMAALMKATIDRDDALPFTTTYQQKTISLEKARAMRQRPPNLMDDDDADGSADAEKKSEYSKESIQDSVIHEEDEKGLAITGLDDAKALLAYADQSNSNSNSEGPKHEYLATGIAN